jgi:hypothetical protein
MIAALIIAAIQTTVAVTIQAYNYGQNVKNARENQGSCQLSNGVKRTRLKDSIKE